MCKMKRILTTTSFAGLCLVLVAGPANTQQREEYCEALKMLLQSAKDGFEATAEVKLLDGRIERWHIRQDARVWRE